MRHALGLEYDGSGFLGWQAQRHSPTVQTTLEAALERVADHSLRVVCAGRTDTGVHASGQVVHFDASAERSERSWVLGCNSHLPDSVTVLWARAVPDDFHARFSAHARRYRYRILNRWTRPALLAGRAAWCREPLDADAMHRAAQALAGEHDFSAFRSAGCQANHAVRRVLSVSVQRGNDEVRLDIEANAFLYHMVRNIAGSLMAVGRGEQQPAWIGELLEARDRSLAGVTAPADGLYFTGVRYPPEFGLPEQAPAFPRGWDRS